MLPAHLMSPRLRPHANLMPYGEPCGAGRATSVERSPRHADIGSVQETMAVSQLGVCVICVQKGPPKDAASKGCDNIVCQM